MRTRNIDELRAIHAQKLYRKNGNIIVALKAKHGNKNLDHDDVFNEHHKSWGLVGTGHNTLKENAEIIDKYSLNPKAEFKIKTPINLHKPDPEGRDKYDRLYEPQDQNSVQKFLYKNSGKMVEMSPNEFLGLASPVNSGVKFDRKTEKMIREEPASYTNEKDYFPDSIKHLRKNMGKGAGEIPQLSVKETDQYGGGLQVQSHEGRHRAFVAREKGIKKIPVLITSDHSDHDLSTDQKNQIERKLLLPEKGYSHIQ